MAELMMYGGGVSSSTPAASLTTAGQGYFWGAAGPNDSSLVGTSTAISPTGANNVLVFQFILPYAITIRKVTFANGTTVTAAATANFGIYSLAGNLLLDSGAFSTAVASQTLSNTLGAAVNLPAGIYWFAQACTNATNTSAGAITWNTTLGTGCRQLNVVRQGVAANAYASSALPPTLGVVTGNSNRGPVAVLFET